MSRDYINKLCTCVKKFGKSVRNLSKFLCVVIFFSGMWWRTVALLNIYMTFQHEQSRRATVLQLFVIIHLDCKIEKILTSPAVKWYIFIFLKNLERKLNSTSIWNDGATILNKLAYRFPVLSVLCLRAFTLRTIWSCRLINAFQKLE